VTYCEAVTRRPGRLGRKAPQEPVYQITGARRGVRDDVNSRTRRYLLSMGVRTVCFVLAVVASGWLRWVFIVLALVLPYLSVVFANGGRERAEDMPESDLTTDRRALGGTQT
jgi:Flp pilus assembly protein TadB